MHIADIFAAQATTFSFEFFPPRSVHLADEMFATISEFESLHPSFVSVTYGAGGSAREWTHDLVERLHEHSKLDPVPHLTSVCHSEDELREIITRYAALGISNMHALSGDPPKTMANYDRSKDAFRYAADLVRFIRKVAKEGGHPDPRGFGIGVAGFPEGHPATPNRLLEMDYLKAKVDAGADYIVTQMFFSNPDFFDFRERCELAGIHVPIIAGIMPISSIKGIRHMAGMALGSRYPAKLLRAIGRAGDDEEYVKKVGIHWATEQCRDLLDNSVRGIHFYTLNRSTATREIFAALGVRDSQALRG